MSVKLTYLLLTTILIFSTINCHGHHDHDHDHDHDHHDHQHPSHVVSLANQNIQSMIDSHSRVLIKFFAPWCGHCKTLAPTYDAIAQELTHANSDIVIASVDCTVHKQACGTHSIRGYPILKYFINGQAHQYSGSRTKEAIIEWLEKKPIEVEQSKKNQEL